MGTVAVAHAGGGLQALQALEDGERPIGEKGKAVRDKVFPLKDERLNAVDINQQKGLLLFMKLVEVLKELEILFLIPAEAMQDGCREPFLRRGMDLRDHMRNKGVVEIRRIIANEYLHGLSVSVHFQGLENRRKAIRLQCPDKAAYLTTFTSSFSRFCRAVSAMGMPS